MGSRASSTASAPGERLQEPVEEPLTIECKRWLTGEPRQWATFEELPEEPWLQVRAAGGEVWKYCIPGRNTEYDFLDEPAWLWHSDGPRTDALKVGPFTEVVDG